MGSLSPPKGSSFVWVEILVAKATSLPSVVNVLGINLMDREKVKYHAVGIRLTLPEIKNMEPSITSMIEPVGSGSSPVSTVETSSIAHDAHDAVDYEFTNFGPDERKATLTVKKLPASFAVLFVVPSKEGSFSLNRIAQESLLLGKLTPPK